MVTHNSHFSDSFSKTLIDTIIKTLLPGVVVHAHVPSTWEAETRGLWIPGPGQQSETLFRKKGRKKKKLLSYVVKKFKKCDHLKV
jgi:hypothetical protein